MESRKNKILDVSSKIIFKIGSTLDTPAGKSYLAKLRNSVGKPLNETSEVWSILFEFLPEEMLGRGNNMSASEKAILTTLQLYSIHQQGMSKSVNMEPNEKIRNLGYSLRLLRKEGNTTALDRRFNTMITSDSFEEFSYHLRQLIKILKSNNSNIEVDYPRLSLDLYRYINGSEANIRLSWSREYYKLNNKGDKENEK